VGVRTGSRETCGEENETRQTESMSASHPGEDRADER
jgi:hypothetical protein